MDTSRAPVSDASAPKGASPPRDARFLIGLTVLALATRLLWTLLVHPPGEYLFRDMLGYVFHARWLVEHGLEPLRSLVFQAWGTSLALALMIKIFGGHFVLAASVLWGVASAASVAFVYLLARRVLSARAAAATGIAALCWYPNIVNAGFFLSEGLLLCLLPAATWRFAVLLQEGRGALSCGLLFAACIITRFESAVVLGLACVLLLLTGGRPRALIAVLAAPLVATTGALVFHHHSTGAWGLAESGRANLTLARCHVYRVQGYDSPDALESGAAPARGRSFGLPSFGMRFHRGELGGAFGLRPALGVDDTRGTLRTRDGVTFPFRVTRGGSVLSFVGHRADREINAALQRECARRTGLSGQLAISLTNMSQLWFGNSQWPDNSDRGTRFLPWSDLFVRLFQVLVLIPSLAGVALALRGWRRAPALALCALPLLSIMLVASIWFGEIRLRTPYDPFALLLAVWVYSRLSAGLRGALRRTRSPG